MALIKSAQDGRLYDDSVPRYLHTSDNKILFDRLNHQTLRAQGVVDIGGQDEIGGVTGAYIQGNSWPGGPVVSGKLKITSPADGSTQTDPDYAIVGEGAEPGAEVNLWTDDTNRNAPAQDTTTADDDGKFEFSGGMSAPDGTTIWSVSSGGLESRQARVTVAAADAPTKSTAKKSAKQAA